MPNYNTNAFLYGNDCGYYLNNNQRQQQGQGYVYPQPPAFNGYANNNLLNNSPYNNYMGINNNFQNQQQHTYLKCRPVSSEEEARASQIDLDGSLWVFTDVGNKKIYTKQVDANGLSVFNVYTLDAETQVGNPTQTVSGDASKQEQPQYITKEEFDKAIVTLAAAIKDLQKPAPAAQQTLLDFK